MNRFRNRQTAVLIAVAATLGAAWLGAQTTKQAPVRGNVPGEWRYWGADAWSTRYSSLDQINATNFSNLQVAWTFNAGELGGEPNEYYRTTPLFANGRLFTVATLKRIALALDPSTGKQLWKWEMDEGIRYQKAVRQFAGRGLALLDRRPRRARHHHHAGVPHGSDRRENRQARSQGRQGRRGRSDGRPRTSHGAACG